MVTIGVLALQGDVREHVSALEDCGAKTQPVRRASDLKTIDGVILPGGESTTMSTLLHAFHLFEPLRAAISAGLPTYGTCAGMILLAKHIHDGATGQQTLDALPMSVRRNAFGGQVNSFEADLDLAEITDGQEPFRAVFIRAPWVEEISPEVQILGRVASGVNAGRIVAVRHGAVLATSFHPEITADTRLHNRFISMVKQRS